MSSLKRALTAVGGLVDIRDLHLYGGIALLVIAGHLAIGGAMSLAIAGLGLIYVAERG